MNFIGIIIGLALAAGVTFLIVTFCLCKSNDCGFKEGDINDFGNGVRILSRKEVKWNYNPSIEQRAEAYIKESINGKRSKNGN